MCKTAQPGQQEQPGYERLQPFSKWSQDQSNHILLVDLPGFNKGDVKVKVDNSGKIIVSGTKEEVEHRHQRIEETFPIPETCSTEKICARFEHGLLRLFIPKAIPCHDSIKEKIRRDKETEMLVDKQQSFLDSINKHTTTMALAMAAFSVGFYVCHHLRSSGK